MRNFSVLNFSSAKTKRRFLWRKKRHSRFLKYWRQGKLYSTAVKKRTVALNNKKLQALRFRRSKKSVVRHFLQKQFTLFRTHRHLKKINKPLVSELLYKKRRVNSLDKLFFFFQFHNKISLFIYKIFIYMEMLVYSVLLSTGLMKYLFIIKDACFYRLVLVNKKYVKSAFHTLSIYDTISVYNKINYYFYYQQFQQFLYNRTIKVFFQSYIRNSHLFHQSNK